jgi:hypothetical protein
MKLLGFLLFLASSTVWAATDDTKVRDQMSERARARLYDGGLDEQPLTVQPLLTEPKTDGSEYVIQKKVLNSEPSGGDSESPASDETSSGF